MHLGKRSPCTHTLIHTLIHSHTQVYIQVIIREINEKFVMFVHSNLCVV